MWIGVRAEESRWIRLTKMMTRLALVVVPLPLAWRGRQAQRWLCNQMKRQQLVSHRRATPRHKTNIEERTAFKNTRYLLEQKTHRQLEISVPFRNLQVKSLSSSMLRIFMPIREHQFFVEKTVMFFFSKKKLLRRRFS
jgi:hypothetical protein